MYCSSADNRPEDVKREVVLAQPAPEPVPVPAEPAVPAAEEEEEVVEVAAAAPEIVREAAEVEVEVAMRSEEEGPPPLPEEEDGTEDVSLEDEAGPVKTPELDTATAITNMLSEIVGEADSREVVVGR